MSKLKIKAVFSSEFISPENEISWEKRSTEITSDAGKTIFKQEGVEIPKSWSPLATKIAVSKYFYGDISNGTDPTKGGRESSIKQLVNRVTETIAKWGMQDGYFESERDAETFGSELKWLCLNQYGAFNSPVWFNVGLFQSYGVDGGQTGNWVYNKATDKAAIWKNQYEYPQASACFIQSVDDTMESIMKLAYSEAMLFKYGSGTGSDLSTIRSTKEKLSGGGKPSGPMSFLKIYDQVAGTVKSGGKCLAPNQLVYTEVGPVAVKELAESEKDFVVLSYDPPAGRMKAKWARAWQSGNKPVVKIETDKGEFHVSFDHPMRLADDQTVRAGDLIVGQRLHAVTVIDQNGYKSVRSKGGRELLHRLIAQDISGFDIDGHVIHHKDEVVANCHPDNLALMEDQSKHAGLHSSVLVAAGEHVFQTHSFKHSGEDNGMHRDSDFWKDEQKVAAYRETQGSILTESGQAADMQKVAADQKMLNTAWTLLNSGFQIETWEDYRFAREKLIGRMGDPRKVLSAIVDRFGSYESFRKEVDAQNHCVVSVTPMGNLDVYSVEVDCPTADDKSANSGHTYTLWPIGNNASYSAGVLCMNTRRAAKMNTLKTSHPDIEEFIDAKAKEERKAWALIDAGYDGSFNGDAYGSVMYQNENLSVRADDAFMNAAVENKPYFTLAVKDGKPIEEKNAGVLMTKIAEGTYVCGDPGMQFDDTIHKWHTCKGTARQNSTNPCLLRGTRLLTNRGWIKVEDLSNQLDVNLFDGFGFVAGKVWKTGVKKLVKVTTNNGRDIITTPDHLFLSEGRDVKASDLKDGDFLPYVLPSIFIDGDKKAFTQISGRSGKQYISSDRELLEVLGFMQGDGSVKKNTEVTHVYFTPEKDGRFISSQVLPVLDDIAFDEDELEATASKISNNVSGYSWSRKKLTTWLRQIGLCNGNLPERTLPEFVFRLKSSSTFSFLRGLFSANGNVLNLSDRKAVLLVSSCKPMLQEVQLIMQSWGINSSVRIHDKEKDIDWDNGKYTSKESYHLEITHHRDVAAFARHIGFVQENQMNKLNNLLKDRENTALSTDSALNKRASMKVISVEELTEEGEVYDFQVATTHYGLANGIVVHNCSEYLFLDNTACNLASLNLIKFKKADGSFDCDRFVAACRIFITAQEILVDRASYPTKEIAENSHIFRTLGLGFANLGALIMSLGLAYDSNEGRAIAGAITSLMTSTAYHQSSVIAAFYGEFPGYHNAECSGIPNPLKPSNAESMLDVIALHKKACEDNSNGSPIWKKAKAMWEEAYHMGTNWGYRNAQVTVLAPTGTIGFLMDCDTTGIEPDIALVKYKLLAGGGNLKIVNQSVEPALVTLGYNETEIAKIIRHIDIYDTIEDIGTYGEIAKSGLLSSHLVVFDCAFKAAKGTRSLHYMGHLKMMAACQPFLSGAISKTVNLPESATIDDIRNAYIDGWKMGLKAIAVYRDGSKRSAPLSTKTESKEVAVVANDELEELRSYIASLEANCESPVRKRLPDTRSAINHKFEIAGHKGYLSVGLFDNGDPGEIFISMSKEGSTIGGLVDTVATLTSLSLQYGVPLKDLVNKFAYQRFEPSGFTKNPDIRNATSIIDYVFRWLGCQFVEGYKKETPLLDKSQATAKALGVNPKAFTEHVASSGYLSDPCSHCGSSKVIRSGVCGVCTECGTSQGCS